MMTAQEVMDVNDVLGPLTQRDMPKATTLVFPDIVATANAGLGAYTNITPQNLNQRLPNIVNSTPSAVVSGCDPFTDWINNNPLLAMGALAAVAIVVWGGKR